MRAYTPSPSYLLTTSFTCLWLFTLSASSIPADASGPPPLPTRGKVATGTAPKTGAERAAQDQWWRRTPDRKGAVPAAAYLKAAEQARRMPRYDSATGMLLPSIEAAQQLGLPEPNAIGFASNGPNNVGGRTRGLVFHPSDPNTMFAASVAGGVWTTNDGGGTWKPLMDASGINGPASGISGLAVSSLAVDPVDGNIIYAGTGEGFYAIDYVEGAGIFRSDNGGKTWLLITPTAFPANVDYRYINKIVISPHDRFRVYAATRTGVFRCNDVRATPVAWTRIHVAQLPGGILDMVAKTNAAGDYLIASEGGVGDSPSDAAGRIIRMTDAATAPVDGIWPQVFTTNHLGRTSLAIAPSNQNTVYALGAVVGLQWLRGVYRSTDAGNTWSPRYERTVPGDPLDQTAWSWAKVADVLLTNPRDVYCQTPSYASQGRYANIIAVDPVNPDIVWVGGIDTFRSTDGGANWGIASHWNANTTESSYAHADQHAIVFHPAFNGSSNQIMYIANDGGVFRTDNARDGLTPQEAPPTITVQQAVCDLWRTTVTWVPRNTNYVTTQFYHGTVFDDGIALLSMGGTQDNGTLITSLPGNPPGAWYEFHWGDGFYAAVRPRVVPQDDLIYFFQDQVNGLWRKVGAGGAPSLIQPSPSDNHQWVTPFVLDPSNPDRMWWGGSFIWRAVAPTEPTSWSRVGYLDGAEATAIAVSPVDPEYVFVAAAPSPGESGVNGVVFRTTNGLSASPTWTPFSFGNQFPSGLACDAADKRYVWATFSTVGGERVRRSINGGALWSSISGSIPDAPANCVVTVGTNPRMVYVGTDVGLYVGKDTLSATPGWALEAGIPPVAITALAVKGNKLYAFTHGRGVFSINLCGSTTPVVTPPPVATVYQSNCAGGHGVTQVSLDLLTNRVCATYSSTWPIPREWRKIEGAYWEFLRGASAGCAGTQELSAQHVTMSGGNEVLQDITGSYVIPVGPLQKVRFRFRSVQDPTKIGTADGYMNVYRIGDLDLNWVVDVADLQIQSNFVVGNIVPGVAPFNASLVAASCDEHEVVNIWDIQLLANYIVGNVACLVGDVSGCALAPARSGQSTSSTAGTAVVSLGARRLTGKDSSEIPVFVDVTNVTVEGRAAELGALQLRLEYSPMVTELLGVDPGTDGYVPNVVCTSPDRANAAGQALIVWVHGSLTGPSGKVHVATLRVRERGRVGSSSIAVMPEHALTPMMEDGRGGRHGVEITVKAGGSTGK